jgi:hypothetical protein
MARMCDDPPYSIGSSNLKESRSMQLSNPPSLRRISQNLIILSWLLFAIALILPAGKYTVEFINLPFGGSRPEPQEIYGWLALIISIFSTFFISIIAPFFILQNSLTQDRVLLFSAMIGYVTLLWFLSSSKYRALRNSIYFKYLICFVIILILWSITHVVNLYVKNLYYTDDNYLHHSQQETELTAGFIFFLFTSCICFALETFKKRLYAITSLVMFLPPALILSLAKDFEPNLFFIFPFITLGTLLILISCISYRQRKTSNYYLWLVRNLTVANCFILLAIQEFPPAAIFWCFSIASLVAGCNLKNENIDEIDSEHGQQDIAEI